MIEGLAMLYVSTTLQSFEAADAEPTARDILHDEVVYRRLDPEFYAWLRQRMTVAEKAKRSGKLPTATFDQLRERFNPIHAWAVEHLGQEALLYAIRKHDAKSYAPPSIESVEPTTVQVVDESPTEFRFPEDGEWAFTQPVEPDVIRQVDAIRDRALSCGWTESRLYKNRGRFRFPCGQDYGLVCFLGDGRSIGEVTEKHIEIIGAPLGKTILRFYNPDVDQPWIRKIEAELDAETLKTTELAA